MEKKYQHITDEVISFLENIRAYAEKQKLTPSAFEELGLLALLMDKENRGEEAIKNDLKQKFSNNINMVCTLLSIYEYMHPPDEVTSSSKQVSSNIGQNVLRRDLIDQKFGACDAMQIQ